MRSFQYTLNSKAIPNVLFPTDDLHMQAENKLT